ncbi:MAG: hypothetical protein ACKOK8_06465, partial [Planctomycetia bacterium]
MATRLALLVGITLGLGHPVAARPSRRLPTLLRARISFAPAGTLALTLLALTLLTLTLLTLTLLTLTLLTLTLLTLALLTLALL